MKEYTSYKLVKSSDLNHHNTLFAGTMAMWFIENSFICASSVNKSQNIVFLKCDDFIFKKPCNKGDIIKITSMVINTGKSSFTVYSKVSKNDTDEIVADGFLIFINVDENGKKKPHNITLDSSNNTTKRIIDYLSKLQK